MVSSVFVVFEGGWGLIGSLMVVFEVCLGCGGFWDCLVVGGFWLDFWLWVVGVLGFGVGCGFW